MREVCASLERWTGGRFRPRPTIVEPSEGWQVKGDVQHAPGLWFPFSIECKKVEKWELDGLFEAPHWPVWTWWRQCESQALASENERPLLIFSRNRRKSYVLTEAATLDWLKLRPKHGPRVQMWTPRGVSLGLCLLDDLVHCTIPKR